MPVDPEVRRLALAVLLLGYTGRQPPPWLLDALAGGLGGLVLFGSNVGDGRAVGELTRVLRGAASRDIVIAIDEEGGDVTRLDSEHGSASPGAAALGWLDDVAATEAVHAGLGQRCATAGVTLDLAPVADVNLDPHNPVIGLRAFSAGADGAARHVAAAVRGLQRNGVAACLKHFPGHGATREDSHLTVAHLDRGRAELDEVELVPFRAGIEAGARAVMTGHLLVPSLDPNDLATTSRPITTDLLRGELGFDGAVVTDALEMRAIAGTLGIVEGFVAALAAGADAVVIGARDHPALVEQLPAAVEGALRDGRLTDHRLADAAARTRALASPPSAVHAPMPEVAGRCPEVHGALPELSRPLVLECRTPGHDAAGAVSWSVGVPLADLVPGTDVVAVTAPVGHLSPDRSLVVAVRDPHRHRWQHELIAAAARHPCAVVVDVGWPVDLDERVPVVRTRGIAPGLLAATARLLAGAEASTW